MTSRQSKKMLAIVGWALAAIAVVGLAVYLTTHNSQWTQHHDHNTPVGPYESPSNTVVELPYGWNNVVRVCDKGEGIYEAFGGTAIYVVPNDPSCH